jgi:hypothetical protein
MLDRIARMAEKAAVAAGHSRRGFLGRCLGLAGGVGLGMIPLVLPGAASAGPPKQTCSAPWPCKCHMQNYNCAEQCKGCPNEATCKNSCFVFCFQVCSRG